MAIIVNKEVFGGHAPEIWRGECKVLPGGFALDNAQLASLPIGTVIRRGTPIVVDFEKKSANLCKTATVIKGGNTTTFRVAKGHLFAVGDYISKVGDGASTPSIKVIDRTNAEYDAITLSAAYTGLTEKDVVMEVANSAGSEPKYEPNAIVASDKAIDGNNIVVLDAGYEAVVLYPSLAFPIIDAWKQGITMKLNPNILFINQ